MPPSITGEAAHSGDNDNYNERGDYDSHYENVPFKATHSSSMPTSSAKERLNNESHSPPPNPASHRHSVRGAARVASANVSAGAKENYRAGRADSYSLRAFSGDLTRRNGVINNEE